MIFRTRKPIVVDVTAAAFRRWLRAHRPPWSWFLAQPDDVQEQLALIGDEHSEEIAMTHGYAAADPSLIDFVRDAEQGDSAAEEQLALRAAENFAARLLAGTKPEAPAGPTMAGIGSRAQSEPARPSTGRARRLFGQEAG